MPDVEFVDEAPHDDAAVPDVPRRPPGWVWLVAIGAVVVLVIVVLLGNSGSKRPTASPSSGPTGRSSSASPTPQATGLALTGGFRALDVAVGAGRRWVLQPGFLVEQWSRQSVTVPMATAAAGGGPVRLVLDAPYRRLWIVDLGSGRVRGLDAYTLRSVGGADVRGPVTDAAALRGQLFLLGASGVFDLTARGVYAVTVAGTGSLASIAADPLRNRLLATDFGDATRIWVVQPADNAAPRVRLATSVPIGSGVVEVVDGKIWIGGPDIGRGALFRIDPDSLKPVARGALALPGGLTMVAGGDRSFWVRPFRDAGRLECVDASTGAELQSWDLAGQVSSVRGEAVLATTQGAIPLLLHDCPG